LIKRYKVGIELDYLLHINGETVGERLPKIDVFNPANGKRVGSVPNGGKDEAQQAIKAAHESFSTWSQLTAYDRSAYLTKLTNLIIAHKEELGKIMTLEMGKPITQSVGESEYAASFLTWYAEEAKRIYGSTIPSHVPNK